MKRKIIAVFCALYMVVALLTGCSSQENQKTDWSSIISVDWDEHFVDLDTGITMAYMTCGPADGTPS